MKKLVLTLMFSLLSFGIAMAADTANCPKNASATAADCNPANCQLPCDPANCKPDCPPSQCTYTAATSNKSTQPQQIAHRAAKSSKSNTSNASDCRPSDCKTKTTAKQANQTKTASGL